MFQRPLNDKPAGTEKYDNGALTDDQQIKLNEKKVANFNSNLYIKNNNVFFFIQIQQRIDNEKYLRQHPEISLLVKDFFK